MNRLRLIKTAYTALAALMLAACTSDELADGTVQDLPEGKYPLQISSVTMSAESTAEPWGANAPQSRVAESTDGKSSKWNLNDVINVQLAGVTETATFKVSEITTNAVTVTPTNTVYWTKTTDDVTAWYSTPAYTTNGTTVNLAEQTSANGLAYVLVATKKNASHTDPVSLDFSHQLAKVRVKLTGDKASEITAVKVKGYPSCTIDKTSGTVTKNGTETYLSMIENTYNSEKYYEANLAPQDISTTDFVQLTDESSTTHICEVSGVTTLDKAKYYVFNIEVKSAEPTEIQPGADGNYTVNEGADVLIKGNGSQTTGQIIINGTATVTIQNVNIKTQQKPTISITNGTATIKLSGNNILESTGSKGKTAAGIQLNNVNSNVIIEGNDNNSLTITADYGNPAIGSGNGGKGGNITIRNATITAKAINTIANGCGAAIGSGSSWVSREAHIGIITIINSNITASVGDNKNSSAAVIGTGDTTDSNDKNSCQGINITLQDGQSKAQFLEKLTGNYNIQVGAGSNSRGGTNTCGIVNWYNADGTTAN